MENIEIKNYWNDLDLRLESLVKDGVVKLPSIKIFNLEKITNEISNEMGSLTFKELCLSHKNFLNKLQIDKYLSPKLLYLAKNMFNYDGDITNQYHIARKVYSGNSKEIFRAHFDSHLFTLVLPLKIPLSQDQGKSGELVYFPNIRVAPKNEIVNIIQKIYYKRYASKKGIDKLSSLKDSFVENFENYQPILFMGKTTLHTNYPVLSNNHSFRLTLLAHFFDNSPKFGVGSFLRLLRRR